MKQEDYFNLLNDGQISNIFKYRTRKLGQYFALWAENNHLPKCMLTLSTKDNTMQSTLELRREIIRLLNSKKRNKANQGKSLAYFSAIEIALNKNPLSKVTSKLEKNRVKKLSKNYHLHIQIWSDMNIKDIKSALENVSEDLCIHSKLSLPKVEDAKYDYVVKDIKNIDWKLQYILKTQHKGVQLHSSSRKKMANYMITRLWGYMKVKYKDNWTSIKDKYEFVIESKNNGDIIFDKNKTISNEYSNLHIPNNNSYIHVRKDIFHAQKLAI